MAADDPDRAWHAEPVEAVLTALGTDPEGLSPDEAAARLASDGPNELAVGGGRSPLRLLVAQFSSALVLVLFGAAAVSLAVGHAVDAVLIVAILLANGGFGFVQEYRAEHSLEALRELSVPTVAARRDGALRTVPATDLVPGDVVLLEGGDVVPADARLLETSALEVDEAALTGESVPVGKGTEPVAADAPLAERSSLVFRGTSVTRGRATAVVVATGMATEVGAIATALLAAEDRRTPLQRDLDALGRRLGVGVLALAAVVGPLLVLGGTSVVQAALTAISLAVAAIPEGLPAVVTLTLALGVRRMADEHALVRTLPAVEALGAVDVVCTDKTGTLTEGEMVARVAWVPDRTVALGGAVEDDRVARLLEVGATCSDATADDGDPTERAIVDAALAAGLDVEALRAARPRVDEVPFSAERRRMATVHDDVVFVKGAPSTVLERSTRVLDDDGEVPLNDATRERVLSRVDELAADALRVLAFATGVPDPDGDHEADLAFVGLLGLLDPPRPEVRAAVADVRRAGIAVKLVTGDNPRTAGAIAAEIGLDSPVLTGADLDALDDDALRATVETVDVYARAEPGHKVRLLRALQASGHAVAMTGDGVNDGPALKQADVGIAMGRRGTDVARQASDIVLLDDNFATIRQAIRRGRAIYDNLWKFVAYLLSANLAEVGLVLVASLFGYLVLPAVQLLWINLLTDGLPALAIGTDPPGDVMDREPRPRGVGVVDADMRRLVAGFGLVAMVVMLGLTAVVIDGAPSVTPHAMTMVFTGFVVFEFAKLYLVRWTRGTPLASNPWLAAAVGASFALHLAVLYTPLAGFFGTVPLGAADWGLLALTVVVGTLLALPVAWWLRRRTHAGPTA